MEVGDARALLGVRPGAAPEELRDAYRARLRATHPDLRGGGDGGTADVVAAYRLLRALPPEPAVVVAVDGDTVTADLPAGDLFDLLVEAGHAVGHVAYLDRRAGLLEIVADVPGHGACSVVLTLERRAAGHTEAACCAERLGGGPPPPADAVAGLLAEGLRAIAPR